MVRPAPTLEWLQENVRDVSDVDTTTKCSTDTNISVITCSHLNIYLRFEKNGQVLGEEI